MSYLLLNNGGRLALEIGGFLLLDDGVAPVNTSPQGGALGWFYNGSPKLKEKIEQFEEQFVEALQTANVEEIRSDRPEFIRQKQIIAQNILRQLDAIDIYQSPQIQAAIIEAEFKFYQNLARLRELDDEAAILLLIN
jgi:hypothetical protein